LRSLCTFSAADRQRGNGLLGQTPKNTQQTLLTGLRKLHGYYDHNQKHNEHCTPRPQISDPLCFKHTQFSLQFVNFNDKMNAPYRLCSV